MTQRVEKRLGILAFITVIITSILLFIVRPENLGDPVTSEYLLKVILYPSALVLLRAVWKTWLDNKIQSKVLREADFMKKKSAFEKENRGE